MKRDEYYEKIMKFFIGTISVLIVIFFAIIKEHKIIGGIVGGLIALLISSAFIFHKLCTRKTTG